MKSLSKTPILHVEDSPTDALLTRDEIGRHPEFHLTQVNRLEEALCVMATEYFAVVLLDLGLPDSQGLETLLRLRRGAPHIPVVVMTANDNDELALRAVQEGAQDYLVKHQTHEDILARTIRYAIERNVVKQAIHEREELFRGAFEHTHLATVLTDLDHHFVRVNPAFAEMFGYSENQMLQLSMPDITHPDDVAASIAARTPLISGEARFFQLEKRYLHCDGRILWGLTNVSLVLDADGRPFRYVGQVQDITVRKQAEERLRERSALAALGAAIGLAFTRNANLGDMLQGCVESIVEHLGAAFARIWTLNEPDQILELKASAGIYTHTDGPHGRVPVGRYKIGLIAEEKKPHLTNDVAHDPRIGDPAWADREGIVAFAGYPLLLEDRLVGVMAMFAGTIIQEATFQTMGVISNQIALGIERKLQEEALRKSEERFQELTAHIHQVLWMIDARESKVLYVSHAYEEIWGRSRQSLIDNPFSYMEGVHPLDLQMMEREIAAMFQTGFIDVECRILRPDETVRWVWVRGYPVLEQGQIVHLVGIIEDITEKRQMAAERHALLSRLQLHLERMPLAYFRFDADFRIIDCNSSAERIFGYNREEFRAMERPYEELVPGSFREQGDEIRRRIRSGDMQAHSVNENVTKDGRQIICQWSNTPLLDDTGEFTGLICLAQDVTEQKSLQEQLIQVQKMEAVGQLAGGVAHDFNNLLTIINGYSDFILAEAPENSPLRDYAEAIGQAGIRAASLTRQLLAFSRKQLLEARELNLNTVAMDTARMLQRLIGEDIDLRTILEPRLGTVKADLGQIEQVIMNLVVNARDAMSRGGRLTIETANIELDETYTRVFPELRPGRYVMLAVADTGTGMDEATKARVFEPFFTTKEPGKGTGLGLATVFGIIKQSEGYVAVDSALGCGTTFKIYLPMFEEPVGLDKTDHDSTQVLRGSETILLAEDEPSLRGLAAHILKSYGYTVLEAGDGQEAIRIADGFTGAIHLLITDVVMPITSGRELAEGIAIVRPNIKVLYVSGYTDDAVVRHGVLQSETAFLQKPFTSRSLASKVRDILENP